jgi:hypothetical protein
MGHERRRANGDEQFGQIGWNWWLPGRPMPVERAAEHKPRGLRRARFCQSVRMWAVMQQFPRSDRPAAG